MNSHHKKIISLQRLSRSDETKYAISFSPEKFRNSFQLEMDDNIYSKMHEDDV
jgi:hypothetical protein